MPSPTLPPVREGRWTSLWVVALFSLLAHLWLCQFFTLGKQVPMSIDIDPSNLWKYAYTFPPTGSFQVLNWLGQAYLPLSLNPCSLAANLPVWLFFTAFAPLMATCALLAMAMFLRELELPRSAALFGAVIYAWQGDLIPFIFPGHFFYITSWTFFAVAAWGALRAQRTGYWAYALLSGASCGVMVALFSTTDRGAIASLLLGSLYLAPALRDTTNRLRHLRHLALCVGTALIISLASFLALFKGNITGVSLAGQGDRQATYTLVTQFSLGPEEILTYLVPGFFGWHSSHLEGPYWGRIGRTLDWPKDSNSRRNFNLAISTTGTVATLLALIGISTLLPGRWLGPASLTDRQRFFGRILLTMGTIGLVLSWGYHTPFYRPLYALPLMDRWRNPLKWLEMTNFALVVLSAYGVQHLQGSLDDAAADAQLLRRRLTWFCGITVGTFALAVLASYPFAAFWLKDVLLSSTYDAGATANIMSTMIFSLKVTFALSVLFSLLLWALWRPELLRRWNLDNPLLHRLWHTMLRPDYLPLTLALGLAALSVAQLGWVDTQFIQSAELRLLTQTNPLLERLKNESSQVRVAIPLQDPTLNMFMQNQFYADHISCLDISAASRIPDDLNAFLANLSGDQSRLWFLAGVKNVVVPEPDMTELQRDAGIAANVDHADGYTLDPNAPADTPTHALLQLRDYLAKATLVPRSEVIPTEDALLKRLKDPAWNPRDTVLFSKPPPALAQPSEPPADSSVPDHADVKTYTPNEIDIDAQSAQGGYLLINDQYDPDWEVEVNGLDAPLLRADYLLRAIPLPPGHSSISLHYLARYKIGGLYPAALVVNNFSDAAMLAAWLISAIALWRRRDRLPDGNRPTP
jgi:hypothetical protein